MKRTRRRRRTIRARRTPTSAGVPLRPGARARDLSPRPDSQRCSTAGRHGGMDHGARTRSTMRTCRTCGVAKSDGEFYSSSRDGYFVHCKACVTAKRRESYRSHIDIRRKQRREGQRRYRLMHPETFTAEARREVRRRSYEKHRSAAIERSRRWRNDHPGATTLQVKAWAKKNRRRFLCGKVVKENRRRDRTGGRTRLKPSDIIAMLDAQNWLCAYCRCSLREVAYELEHRTPVCRGGRTERDNLCMSCAPCNRRKRNKTAEEFQAA